MRYRSFIKNCFVRIIFASLILYLFSAHLSADSKSEEMIRILKETEFNGAVLVAKKGQVVFKAALGFADLEKKVKLTTRSSFNLASVTKPFTAAGIMLLMERGMVGLDDSISVYFPQLAYAGKITIRHLLNHTSGLPDIYGILEEQWDKSKVAGNKDLIEIFSRQKPELLFEPGDRIRYSNTGYILLASIIEKVSRQPYHEFMEKNIFMPLNMTDSFVYYRTMQEYPRSERVWGLSREGENIRLNDLTYLDGMRGDGNVHSSVEDLFKWDRALYSTKLLKQSTINQMFTPGKLKNGQTFQYGFGWGINENPKSVSHGGGWVGFRSLIVRYLDSQDLFIMLINCMSPKARGIVKKIKKFYSLQ